MTEFDVYRHNFDNSRFSKETVDILSQLQMSYIFVYIYFFYYEKFIQLDLRVRFASVTRCARVIKFGNDLRKVGGDFLEILLKVTLSTHNPTHVFC